MKLLFLTGATLLAGLAGCDAGTPSAPATDGQGAAAPPVAAPAPAAPVENRVVPRYAEPVPQAADSEPDDEPPPIYADYEPPLAQPEPVEVPWAPPPMLVEAPPPPPSPEARWTGGYWVWHERWVWARGRWAEPPRPRYHWVPPYYEHRRDRVVFVDGFWAPPDASFVPPPPNLHIALAVVGAGFARGRPPIGPAGVFVPAPPGSRRGLIVPAPVGTAPAVVTGAPPIVAPGMRVTRSETDRVARDVGRAATGNDKRAAGNDIARLTIEAPSGATADHRAIQVSVPSQARLAAALAPVERTRPVASSPPAAATARAVTAPVAPVAPATRAAPPASQRVESGAPAVHRPDDGRKRPEPVDRAHVPTEAVRRMSPPGVAALPLADRGVPSKPAAPLEPSVHGAPVRPEARVPERAAPAASARAPEHVVPPPRSDSRAPERGVTPVRPVPVAPPAVAPRPVEVPKVEAAKPAEAPKKTVDPREEKKKERDAKGEPPR